jgi:methyl-accepting chemotaxis protein
VPLVNAARRNDPSARTIAATAEGEARINVIRSDFARLLDAERRTSAATARASTESAHRAYAVAVVGIGGSIALVALYAAYLSRAIVRPIRRAATVTARLAAGDLTVRLPETAVGESNELERAFNVMGASLESGRDELARSPTKHTGCAGSRRWSRKVPRPRTSTPPWPARSSNCFRPTRDHRPL